MSSVDYRTVRAIPTTYRGVAMRSKTEARAAAMLDGWGIPWAYEPDLFSIDFIPGTGYRPDFKLWPDGTPAWYLEIKPPVIFRGGGEPADEVDLRLALAKLALIRFTEPAAVLTLWMVRPERTDRGTVLVSVAGSPLAAVWTSRPAGSFLAEAASLRAEAGTPARRRSWWRRQGMS